MTDKQKPYKTTNFRKPRISRIVSAIVILLIVAIGWQEYVGWQTKLRESEDLLQERTSQLDAAESRLQVLETLLQKDTSKFEEYSLFWRRLHEPLGFRVRSESPIELHAITCVRVPEHYRLGASVYDRGYLFHYEILGRKTVTSLIHNDKYKLVGKDSWGADWTYDDHVSYEYYMHEEVHRIFPFRWSSLNDWIYNSWDWEDRLQRYCKNKVKS